MIRATTVFIVLTLAGTPTATPVCIAWCDAGASTGTSAAGCHQRTTTHGTPGLVAGEQECDQLLQAVPFVREDAQRVASGVASDHAVVTAHAGLEAVETDSTLGTAARGHPPEFRPSPSTVLRI